MDMKKITAACATAAALAALCVPGAAFAADGTLTLNAGDGSTLAGHSFTVYKLANYNDVVKDGANVKSVSAKHPDQTTGDWIAAALKANGVNYDLAQGRNAAEQLLRLQTNSNTLRKVAAQTLAYKVTRIRKVDPDDLRSVRIQPGRDLVTLVTCTPIFLNTYRLLVTGERVSMPDDAPYPEDAPRTSGRDTRPYLVSGVTLLAGLPAAIVAARPRTRPFGRHGRRG